MEAKPPIRFRKLRIAWSVGCGLLCVLLAVLWVRSYRWFDQLQFGPLPSKTIIVESLEGQLRWFVYFKRTTLDWSHRMHKALQVPEAFGHETNFFGFNYSRAQSFTKFITPYWSCLLLLAAIALMPWIRYFKWRFSLQTLLIAITLVAVILGFFAASN